MKVVSLIDNVSKCGCCAEHGLSLYIESDCGIRILFDMGQGTLFAENAERLGIDLASVDLAVVSHGHYDHAGGLRTFLGVNSTAPVYIRESAFEEHRSVKESGLKDIGVTRPDGDRLIFSGDVERLPYGITLFSDPHPSFPEPPGNGRLLGPGGLRDGFLHEQSMLIEEGGSAVLFGGCAHRGIANILAEAQRLSGSKVTDVFSGMHIKDAPEGYVDSLAEALGAYEGVRYRTMHCTGEEGYSRLSAILGDRIAYLSCGEAVCL